MKTESRIEAIPGGGVAFIGGDAVQIYGAIVLRRALLMYAQTKMLVNRTYTPKAMMDIASRTTGKVFLRGDYTGAADALAEWIVESRAQLALQPQKD